LGTGEQDLRWIQYVIRDKNAVVAAAKLEEDGDGWGSRGTTAGGDEFVERRDSPAQQSFKTKPKQLKNRPLIKDADNAWLID
jgi:hypothetical protein